MEQDRQLVDQYETGLAFRRKAIEDRRYRLGSSMKGWGPDYAVEMTIQAAQAAMSADYDRWRARIAELADQAAAAGDDWTEHGFRWYLEALEQLPTPWTLKYPENPRLTA